MFNSALQRFEVVLGHYCCFDMGKTIWMLLINSTQLNEHLWTQVLKHLNVHIYLDTISYRYYNQLISRTDLSPIPVRSWVMRWSQQRFVNGVVVCQLVRKLAMDNSNIVSESVYRCRLVD